MSRALVLADVHIPYEDKRALKIALDYAKTQGVDTIVLLGDVLDFYQISRFSKDPARKSLETEFREGLAFLTKLRHMWPEARIVYHRGNHELRLEDYIHSNAGKIASLTADLMQRHLCFEELHIEYKTEPWYLGKLLMIHGHELQGRGGNNIPDVLWRQCAQSVICGHFHVQQEKIFRNYTGDRFWCGSVGMLSGPHDYAPVNRWTQGFAIIDTDSQGRFKVFLKEIHGGHVY